MQRLVYEYICVGCERDLTIDEARICPCDLDTSVSPLCDTCLWVHGRAAHQPQAREWLQ